VQLPKTIFTDIRAITEEHMAAVTFGLTKVVLAAPNQELDENEFYESTKELQFFAHIYNEENVHFDALVSCTSNKTCAGHLWNCKYKSVLTRIFFSLSVPESKTI
jgi:hypothetical protein